MQHSEKQLFMSLESLRWFEVNSTSELVLKGRKKEKVKAGSVLPSALK